MRLKLPRELLASMWLSLLNPKFKIKLRVARDLDFSTPVPVPYFIYPWGSLFSIIDNLLNFNTYFEFRFRPGPHQKIQVPGNPAQVKRFKRNVGTQTDLEIGTETNNIIFRCEKRIESQKRTIQYLRDRLRQHPDVKPWRKPIAVVKPFRYNPFKSKT